MEELKCVVLNEKSQSEKFTQCVIPTYMPFWKRQNCGDSQEISGCWGGVAGRDAYVKHR